jgi:uncharacterized protein YrrD
MQFKENAEVVTAKGDKVGQIDRVVLDPRSKELTHLVVKKGFLFTKDKVVPLDRVETATENRVVLKAGKEEPDAFPEFEETHYVPIERAEPAAKKRSDQLSPLAWYYPVAGGAWWHIRMSGHSGISKPPYVRKTELNIPDGTVALEEGAKVVSKESEHVGEVERVYADDEEQRVTHLLISKGMISKSRKLIPTLWVDSVCDDVVRLGISEHLVEALPEYLGRE